MLQRAGIEAEGFEPGLVRIACADPELLLAHAAISVCRVVRADESVAEDHPRYLENAIVPSGRQRLQPEDREFLLRTIFSDEIGPHTLQFIDAADIAENTRALIRNGNMEDGNQLLDKYGKFDHFMTVTSMAGLATVSTVDLNINHLSNSLDDERRRPGFHVDQWHRSTVYRRLRSPRRVGVNLGSGPRGFSVVFPDIMTVAKELELEPHITPRSAHLAEYIQHRRAEGRDVFCLHFQLPEDAGYVAPTERIGHDGYTITTSPTRLDTTTSTMAFWHELRPEIWCDRRSWVDLYAPESIVEPGSRYDSSLAA